MDWKKVLQPTKGKIIFIVVYLFLALIFNFFLNSGTDLPTYTGFPFPFKIEGSYFTGSPNYVNELYPHLLLIDILIPIGIYLIIGIIGSRKK